VLDFKKGAFKDFKPMKIVGIKFGDDKFIPYNDEIKHLGITMMTMSNWYNTATMYEIEGAYDPKYLKIDPNDKDGWKIYANKVRSIMSKMVGIQMSSANWDHKKKF
jgi:hypothetical protein